MPYQHDITSANSVLVMTVESLYPAGIRLQQFAVDNAATMDQVQIAETRMGVDGHMAAGYTPAIHPLVIHLEASSPSYDVMLTLYNAQRAMRKPLDVTIVATIPSISRAYTWSTGTLKTGTPFHSVQKVLSPSQWAFDFEKFNVTTSAAAGTIVGAVSDALHNLL